MPNPPPRTPPHTPIPPDLPPQALVRMRADRVMAAIEGQEFPLAVNSRYGPVQFGSIVRKTDPEGNDYIEVFLRGESESGDPHFRVWNPPLLIEDPQGPIVAGDRHYREDPLSALVEVVARHGGRQKRLR